MGTCEIEVSDIGVEYVTELLLVQNQQVIETLTAYASQKALAASMSLRGMIGRLQDLHSSSSRTNVSYPAAVVKENSRIHMGTHGDILCN